MIQPNNYFKGNIIDNKKEGKCILTYPSLYFEGNFTNDQKNGPGFVHYYSSNITFKGIWKKDEPYLLGEYTVNDKIIHGAYKDAVNSIDDIVEYKYLLGFIHIPKSGGTDLQNQFIDLLYSQTNFLIKQPKGHLTDNLWYTNNNIKCFTIIRDPIDRFISGFKFLHKNSNKNINKNSNKNINKNININKETDINVFVKNNTFLDNIVFKKQSIFLNGDPKNLFLIKFNKNNNYDNLIIFLKNEFNISFNHDFTNYSKKNVSYSDGLNCVLTQESIDAISSVYSEDIILYSKLSEPYVNYDKCTF
jgi:hypothetical protein